LLIERLKHQKLTQSTMRRAEDVVDWLGAVQAQDFTGAKWALALRAPGLTDVDVERAFTEGRLLRTHVLRPTWHFVTPADIAWMLSLNATRLRRLNLTYAGKLALDARTLLRSRAAIERALAGAQALTRAELSTVLRRARINASGQRLGHLLFDLEQQAVICSGPRRGKNFTYALLAERVPQRPMLSRDEALATLAARYFRSHGPATLRDFAWWSGLTMGDVKRAVGLARIEPVATVPGLQRAAGATYLLPNYDEFVIAYRDRGAIVDPDRARNLGVFTTRELPHYLLIEGRIAGSWRRTISDTRVAVDAVTYEPLSPAQSASLKRQAARYGAFLGLPHELRVSDRGIK
jgi:hypothetical protein